jgi:hypothetical protein
MYNSAGGFGDGEAVNMWTMEIYNTQFYFKTKSVLKNINIKNTYMYNWSLLSFVFLY